MTEIVPLADAVSSLIHDGDTVAMEGFTHLIPHAAGHAVIRAGLKDLTAVRMTPDLIYDQLIGMGCVKKLVFSWGGNPGVGSLHRFRDAVEKGWPRPLEIEERSHADLANAYVAGASGLPFSVIRGYVGSDLPAHNPIIKFITCPFTGEKLAASPAICPDIAVNSCPAGRSQGQRHALGHLRRAEGGGAREPDGARHGGGDRGRAGAPAGLGAPAALGGERGLACARRRQAVLCARLLQAGQHVLRRLGCHRTFTRGVRRLDGAPRARTEDFAGYERSVAAAAVAEGARQA